MRKQFYSHLIKIETIIEELDVLDFSAQEKNHLAYLLDANIHHHVLDVIMDQLTPEEKLIFIEKLKEGDHDKIWEFLNRRIEKIEDKIKLTAEELKKIMKKDISEAKALKAD